MIKPLTKEQISIGDWEFEAQQRGEQPIFLCDFFSRALVNLLRDMAGHDEDYDYLFTNSNRLNHAPKQRDLVIAGIRKHLADSTWRTRFLRDSIEIPKAFNAVADEIEPLLADQNVSNEKLMELWRKMDHDYLKVIPWFYYPWYVAKENMLVEPVKVGLERHRAEMEAIADIDEVLPMIVFPLKKTNFQLEQESMLKLVELAEGKQAFASDPSFKAEAASYLKHYDWLTTFILTPSLPMTYEQLVERVETAIKDGFKENFAMQKEATMKNKAIAERVLNAVTDDAPLMAAIADARELGYVLTAGVEEAYMASARYLPFIQVVAARIGIAFPDIKYLFSAEIVEALESGSKIEPALIDERRKGSTLLMKGGEQYAAFGDEGHALSAWIDRELNKVDTTLKEFKGQIACKGFARGKVRVASQPSEAHALLEGEILVCPMTNPDYVPAMRRSGAIVTDEGGLLSHAAIMSREFNKPCVIGTKIATQLLKDGDMVEVDANTGIIKILR